MEETEPVLLILGVMVYLLFPQGVRGFQGDYYIQRIALGDQHSAGRDCIMKNNIVNFRML